MLQKHSAINSTFKIIEKNRVKYILKKTNPRLEWDLITLKGWMEEYFKQIRKTDIAFPNVIKSYINGNSIVFICEYKGVNALDYITKQRPEQLLKNEKLMQQVIHTFKEAQKHKIFLDPHIKNFVISDKVYYVDFSPPYIGPYIKARIARSSSSEKQFFNEFFEIFHHNNLGYHFMADLLRVHEDFGKVMPEVYELFKKEDVIKGTYSNFIKKVKTIKEIEERKIKDKIIVI